MLLSSCQIRNASHKRIWDFSTVTALSLLSLFAPYRGAGLALSMPPSAGGSHHNSTGVALWEEVEGGVGGSALQGRKKASGGLANVRSRRTRATYR